MVSLRRLTLLALVLVLLAPQTAAAGRLDRLGPGLQVGLFSPNGEAARDRAAAPFGLRNLYLTGGLEQGRRWAPGTPGGEGVADWLRESDAAGATPVLTYYQLQPACPAGGSDERVRVAATVRDRGIMRNYWRDVRAALKLMGANREELVIFHVEPDGWQYLEQLQGARTRVHVSSTGVRELRGLPDDARGYARAFVRLRDRYAPNVALGWHLSAWGVGQVNPASEANSRHIGRVRAAFLHELGRGFDLVVHDPGGRGSTLRPSRATSRCCGRSTPPTGCR